MSKTPLDLRQNILSFPNQFKAFNPLSTVYRMLRKFVNRSLIRLASLFIKIALGKKVNPSFLHWNALFVERSYSQFREDTIFESLRRQLADTLPKFYVDVGANHPINFSNTYLCYCRGWRGLVIEPNEKLLELHKLQRPEDIHICCLVGASEGEVFFAEHTIHELSRIVASSNEVQHDEGFISCKLRKIQSLNTLLQSYLPTGQQIGLINIDCEGHDLEVLKGLDLAKWRPIVIMIEASEKTEGEITKLLRDHGYHRIDRRVLTDIYILRSVYPKLI